MLTKEKIAEIFSSVARIFPGIPSYQEREGLRAQDKIIREQLASRITEQVGNLHHVMSALTNRATLKPLADLDRLCRTLMKLSDMIRFAGYGYDGLFSGTPVDEQKLAELYEYDLSLHQEVEELAVATSTLQQQRDSEWGNDSLGDFRQLVSRLEKRINDREFIFTSP
jgi:hypothetical protein